VDTGALGCGAPGVGRRDVEGVQQLRQVGGAPLAQRIGERVRARPDALSL
jgi:hypothetical protein